MSKNNYYSYTNGNGKKVSGAAAFNHYVYSVKDGIQDYNDEIGAEYITHFVSSHSDIIAEGLRKKAQRSNFKIV